MSRGLGGGCVGIMCIGMWLLSLFVFVVWVGLVRFVGSFFFVIRVRFVARMRIFGGRSMCTLIVFVDVTIECKASRTQYGHHQNSQGCPLQIGGQTHGLKLLTVRGARSMRTG